ncbi:type VI secretion system baseplate subunit TssE [Inquilinus sp. NPDC058860]|uniref:type VI secretion system baseplate subunit TssE n=1 Tax=Inquilinus sp. NPDC058860 TaxID=3346652 RepID=UPI00368ED7E6
MSRSAEDTFLLLSVLDRLLADDADPALRSGTRRTARSLAAIRDGVRRDLETLLNTRARPTGWPRAWTELDSALTGYGLPDFAALPMTSDEHREAFRSAIEAAIRCFEPRFRSVTVRLLDNAEALDRTLRFRIDALMHAEPAPEPMTFDSILEPASRSFSVTAGSHG